MKSKKVMLILHGFPGLSEKDPLRKYAQSFSGEVLIPDLFSIDSTFNIVNIVTWLEKKLSGKKLDVILAVSMGGLIAPNIALKYPNAKLIMIATAPRIDLGIKPYNYLVKNLKPDYLKWIYKGFNHMPFRIYRLLFDIFNPYKGDPQRRYRYYQDIEDTYVMLKKIKIEKLVEILQFARTMDTAEVLKKLENDTLVITGGHDVLMPNKLSLEIKNYIQKSKILHNDNRLHFEVFDDRDFGRVDKFLDN